MTAHAPFSLRARARSFRHAFRGFRLLIGGEHNAWIHAAATLAVVALSVALAVSLTEWALLTLAIGSVWTAEALNAAIERLGDAVSESPHPLVGAAKDLGAAGVLASAIGAAAVGLFVLGPRLLTMLGFT